jgi:hypothetical protein
VDEDPARVFAIGCKYGWRDVMIAAAQASLKRPITDLVRLPCPREVSEIPVTDLYKLLGYRKQCEEKVLEGLPSCQFPHIYEGWPGIPEGWTHQECPEHIRWAYCKYDKDWMGIDYFKIIPPEELEPFHRAGLSPTFSWIYDFYQETIQYLKNSPILHGNSEEVMESFVKHSRIASECPNCKKNAILLSWKRFQSWILDDVKKVDINVIFE